MEDDDLVRIPPARPRRDAAATSAPGGVRRWVMHDADELRELFPGATFAAIGPVPFRAEAVRRSMPRVTIEGIAATPYLVRRLEREIVDVPRHTMFLHVVLDGRGEVERDSMRFTATPCDVFLLRPDEPFRFRCPVWTRTFRASVPESLLPLDLRGRYTPPFAVLPASAVTRAFLRFAQDLLLDDAYAAESPASEAHLEAALIALELGALAEAIAQQPPRTDDRSGLRAAVLNYIEANLRDRALSPATIAAEFGISVRTVHNLFSALPETPAQHIRRRRTEEAASILRVRDATAAELAATLGFASGDTFTRAFQQQQGARPSEYRALRRELSERGRAGGRAGDGTADRDERSRGQTNIMTSM